MSWYHGGRAAIVDSHTDAVVLNLELEASATEANGINAAFTGSFDQKIIENWSHWKAAVVRFSCRTDLIAFMTNKDAWKVGFQATNLAAPQVNATHTEDVKFTNDYVGFTDSKMYPSQPYFNIQTFVTDVNKAIATAYIAFLAAIGGRVPGQFDSTCPFLYYNEDTNVFAFAGPATGYNAQSTTEVHFLINHELWNKIPGIECTELKDNTPTPFPWFQIPFKCRGYMATDLKLPYELSTSHPDAKDFVLNKQKTKCLSALQDIFSLQVMTTSLPIRTEITPILQNQTSYSQIQYEEQITDFIIDLDSGGTNGIASFVAPYLRYFDFTSNNANGSISFGIRVKYANGSTYPVRLPPKSRSSIKLQIESKKHVEKLLALQRSGY